MTGKAVLRRAASRRDLESASDYYEAEAGPEVAARLVDAVRATHEFIGLYPGAGSPRFGHEAGIAGLRSRPVPRFPYLIFYVELQESVEVWRVLHSHSDIPAQLQQETAANELDVNGDGSR